MSLPAAFQTAEEYFEAASQLFRRYQFLCTAPNTDVLVNNVLDAIDLAGVDEGDVCDSGLGTLATRNCFLKEFYSSVREMKVSYAEHVKDEELELKGVGNAPLGVKKRHEVVYLAKEVQECCERAGCSTVVDCGSGLGYLDQRIHSTTSYSVLGLECNDQHYVTAKTRQRKYHESSLGCVQYVKHTVGAGSQAAVQRLVRDTFGAQPYCVAGLHACADLTVDALNIFLKSSDAQALILMPCCYHKMREVSGRFPNFPLSCSLRSVFERRGLHAVLAGPFLRLAAQPAAPCHSLHQLVFNLLARAALQLYAHARNCKIKRNKRKAVRTKEMENNFESYIQSAARGFSLVSNEPARTDSARADCTRFEPARTDSARTCCTQLEPTRTDSARTDCTQLDLPELRHIWQQITNSNTLKRAGIFILLQQAVQEVAENLILFDRLMFLRERGIEKCAFKKIFNEKISPRALALVAYK